MLYFATQPASENDLFWPFLDFLSQRASTPDTAKAFTAIRDDIMNLAASLAKIQLLEASREQVPHGLFRMVGTDVEYIILVCRGIFDFLQEFLRGIWATVSLSDKAVKKRDLRKTFREMAMFQGNPVEPASLMERFGLPENLANCYVAAAKAFLSIRKFRDSVVHHGAPLQTIFNTERGFEIGSKFAPMPHLQIWHDHERGVNDLVPLLPALQVIIWQTLRVCDEFSLALEEVIQFPDPLAPNMHLYIRSDFTEHLLKADQSASERFSR